MVTLVHRLVVSGFQSITQNEPALNTSPGPGAVGTRPAEAKEEHTRAAIK